MTPDNGSERARGQRSQQESQRVSERKCNTPTYRFVAFEWISQLTDHRLLQTALHIVVLNASTSAALPNKNGCGGGKKRSNGAGSHVLPSGGRTEDLTPEYLSSSGMVTLSAAWWASSPSFPAAGRLVTFTISLIIFIFLLN